MTSAPENVASWRKWSGYVIVGLLAAALIVISSNRSNPTGAPVAITTGSVPVVSTFPPPNTDPTTVPVPAPVSTSAPPGASVTDAADINAIVEEGLRAWGEFAVSGQLDLVRPWFWEDGPQWANLAAEAPGIEARGDTGPDYSVSIEEVTLSDVTLESAEEAVSAAGSVRFSRSGEQTQQFRWTVVVVRRGGEWRIWAVEPSA